MTADFAEGQLLIAKCCLSYAQHHLRTRSRTISTPCCRPAIQALQEMERQAKQRDIPIVGPAVARLFYQYAQLINAETVFEMGSA